MSGTLTPIETVYNGYRFRSRLEARWAVFFDKLHIKYEYEPEGYKLSDGTCYLPDFYLPESDTYVEIKGVMTEADQHKVEQFIKDSGKAMVIGYSDFEFQACDKWWDGTYTLADRSSSVFVKCRVCGKYYFMSWGEGSWECRCCGAHDGTHHYVGQLEGDGDKFLYSKYGQCYKGGEDNKLAMEAVEVARQARFEHGESPETAPVTIPEPTMQPVQVWRPSLPVQYVKTAHRTAMVSGNDTDKYKAAMHVFSHMCLTGAVLMKKGRFVGADSTTVYVEFDERARTIAETVSLPNMMNPMEDALSEAFGRPMRCQITVAQAVSEENATPCLIT